MEIRFEDERPKPSTGEQFTVNPTADAKDGRRFGEELQIAYHRTANIPNSEAESVLKLAAAQAFGILASKQTSVEFVQNVNKLNLPKLQDLEGEYKNGMNAMLANFGIVADDVRLNKVVIDSDFYNNYEQARHKLVVDQLAAELKRQSVRRIIALRQRGELYLRQAIYHKGYPGLCFVRASLTPLAQTNRDIRSFFVSTNRLADSP